MLQSIPEGRQGGGRRKGGASLSSQVSQQEMDQGAAPSLRLHHPPFASLPGHSLAYTSARIPPLRRERAPPLSSPAGHSLAYPEY